MQLTVRSNGRHEGHNNKIRTMTRRAYGFHSPEGAPVLLLDPARLLVREVPGVDELERVKLTASRQELRKTVCFVTGRSPNPYHVMTFLGQAACYVPTVTTGRW